MAANTEHKTTKHSAVVTFEGDRTMVVTREFNAPLRLVWRVNCEPELIRRWWHSGRGEMTECSVDLRVGGRWRYAMVVEGGIEVAFSGEYREVEPGRRVVFTELFEGMPEFTEADASVNTVTFTEHDGRTTMVVRTDFAAPEHMRGAVESGMEVGMQDAYDLLEELAVGLA